MQFICTLFYTESFAKLQSILALMVASMQKRWETFSVRGLQSSSFALLKRQHLLHLQDVASTDAGKLLGLTNSCSTAVGILGNLVTGQLAGMEHGYGIMFTITAVLYFASFCTWNLFMRGAPVRL